MILILIFSLALFHTYKRKNEKQCLLESQNSVHKSMLRIAGSDWLKLATYVIALPSLER